MGVIAIRRKARRDLRWPLLIGLILGLAATGCRAVDTLTSASTDSSLLDVGTTAASIGRNEYVDYVEEALRFAEETYYLTGEVDWESIRNWVLDTVESDPTIESAHAAVEFAIRSLTDPHSAFLLPEEASEPETPDRDPPSGERLDGGIGYLHLPGVSGLSDEAEDYSSRVRSFMEEIDSQEPACGWIIDLRHHLGGDVIRDWLGIGPLIGLNPLMAFVSNTGVTTVSYGDGSIVYEGEHPTTNDVAERFSLDGYIPSRPDAPVAVLTSFQTRSAGEMVVISFVGRPDTRIFGEHTRGVTTGTEVHELPDGALVVIAATRSQDRGGHVYDAGVEPDVPMVAFPEGEGDPIIDAASDWLAGTQACAADGN